MATLQWNFFLNRVFWWDPTTGRAELEAGTRHVAMVRFVLGLEKSTLVVTGDDDRLTDKSSRKE